MKDYITVFWEDKWYPAFWNFSYGDYVIEPSRGFDTEEELELAIQNGEVFKNMPDKYEGK